MRRHLHLLLLLLALVPSAAYADDTPIVPRGISLAAARIESRVRSLACDVGVLPGRGVYDWGCAPPENRVLLAHAYAAFRPLSRAYDRGQLTRGRLLVVRGTDGKRHRYRLAWARVVPRSMVWRHHDGWEWAYGATSRPSVTLITCRGRHSERRLVVRFVLVPSS